MRAFFLLCVWLACSCHCVAAEPLPDRVLWAWKRAEDLTFLNPGEFGVAYLACHVLLRGDEARFDWRQQRLRIPEKTAMVPVVRIDVDHRVPCAFSQRQLDQLVTALAKLAGRTHAAQVQIDFDALQTERMFYRRLLEKLHQTVPSKNISITALASWCLFDNWIKDLPVQETVPMMFSLGRDRRKIVTHFQSNSDFRFGGCCRSLGLSLEEPDMAQLMISVAERRKIPLRFYVYSKTAWSPDKLATVRTMLHDQRSSTSGK